MERFYNILVFWIFFPFLNCKGLYDKIDKSAPKFTRNDSIYEKKKNKVT